MRPDWWIEGNRDIEVALAAKTPKVTRTPSDKRGKQLLTPVKQLKGGKWRFECECGKSHIAKIGQVNAGRIRSCGCSRLKSQDEKKETARLKQKRYYYRHREQCVERAKKWKNENGYSKHRI